MNPDWSHTAWGQLWAPYWGAGSVSKVKVVGIRKRREICRLRRVMKRLRLSPILWLTGSKSILHFFLITWSSEVVLFMIYTEGTEPKEGKSPVQCNDKPELLCQVLPCWTTATWGWEFCFICLQITIKLNTAPSSEQIFHKRLLSEWMCRTLDDAFTLHISEF